MTAGGPEGPYLYDDAPEALHTGIPRRRNWTIVWIVLGTVILAVAAVVVLPLMSGSPATQSKQAVGVFLAAMEKGDTETTFGLLCDAERARIKPEQVATEYGEPGTGQVDGSEAATHDGKPAQRVTVRWSDGQTSRFTVINQSGPHICGMTKG
jgi:hypothetical protein